jgi:hypothetical protein
MRERDSEGHGAAFIIFIFFIVHKWQPHTAAVATAAFIHFSFNKKVPYSHYLKSENGKVCCIMPRSRRNKTNMTDFSSSRALRSSCSLRPLDDFHQQPTFVARTTTLIKKIVISRSLVGTNFHY